MFHIIMNGSVPNYVISIEVSAIFRSVLVGICVIKLVLSLSLPTLEVLNSQHSWSLACFCAQQKSTTTHQHLDPIKII